MHKKGTYDGCEVTDKLIFLTLVIILQYICILNNHVYFKYTQLYLSIINKVKKF